MINKIEKLKQDSLLLIKIRSLLKRVGFLFSQVLPLGHSSFLKKTGTYTKNQEKPGNESILRHQARRIRPIRRSLRLCPRIMAGTTEESFTFMPPISQKFTSRLMRSRKTSSPPWQMTSVTWILREPFFTRPQSLCRILKTQTISSNKAFS